MKRIPLFLMILSFVMASCVVVRRHDVVEQTLGATSASPKPQISMSEKPLASPFGDFITLLPSDWFFVDAGKDVSPAIFATVVNPDYTLSLVFSFFGKDEQFSQSFTKDSLIGCAKESFRRKVEKTSNVAKLMGKYTLLKVGIKKFGVYEYSTDNGITSTKIAVFRSSFGNFYEIALAPLNFTTKLIPNPAFREKVFTSLLTTVDF